MSNVFILLDTFLRKASKKAHVLAFFEAFLRTSMLQTLVIDNTLHHTQQSVYINYSFMGSFNIVALMSVGHVGLHVVNGWPSSRFHKESLRFIPKGYEIPKVLIHLLSGILWRNGSWLYSWFIATAVMSPSMCPLPFCHNINLCHKTAN